MVEDNRDPFEFDNDPLEGADDLDLPSFGSDTDPLDAYRDSTQSFAPPTQPPGVPEVTPPASPPSTPSASPPPAASFPPPAAGTAYPGSSSEPPTSFPPPTATPPSSSFPPPGDQSAFPPPEASAPPASFPAPGAAPAGGNFADFPPPSGSMPGSVPPGSQPPPGSPPPGTQAPNYGAPPAYGQGYAPGVAPPVKKKGRGCLFWGVILSVIFALLIGGCIAAGVLLGQSASDAANSFLDAVEDGDYEDAASQANQACGLTAAQIEADLGGMTDHFIIAIGPIASGEVNFGSRTESIAMELRDDLVCSYEILEQ